MAEKIGSGRRSKATAAKAARKGAKNPAAVAAHIARKQWGNDRANALSAAGRRLAKARRKGEANDPGDHEYRGEGKGAAPVVKPERKPAPAKPTGARVKL